jgi:hypothetical protein
MPDLRRDRASQHPGLAMTAGNHDLIWRGDDLCAGSRRLVSIVPDKTWPSMWRVRQGDKLSDMTNITRARDAARAVALAILNGAPEGEERPLAAPPMRSSTSRVAPIPTNRKERASEARR